MCKQNIISLSVWTKPLDTSVKWPKRPEICLQAKVFLYCLFIFTYLSHLNPQNNIVPNCISNRRAFVSAVYFPFRLQCGDYHSGNEREAKHAGLFLSRDKTKAQLLESRLQQRNSLEKVPTVSFYKIKQSDTSKYYSILKD